MKQNLIMAAALACLCASCANDAVIEENRASDEIKFRVNTEGTTRADIYCPNNMFTAFDLYAYDNSGALMIDGDQISKSGNDWINSTITRYWPETGNVTFFGIKNAEFGETTPAALTDGSIQTEKFTVAAAVADQVDFVYARNTGSKSNSPVALNFRHALSQIVYNAKITNESLTVVIDEISICNAAKSGVYTLPKGATTGQVTEGNDHVGSGWSDANNTRGSWTVDDDVQSYKITTNTTLNSTNKSASISTANSATALMLIPNAALEAWVPAKGEAVSETSGTYFLIKAKITQKNSDTEAEATIWDGNIAIPVNIAGWVEGKRYIYT
ncbi:MAG: fimbrillin family protein, partial [Muribaculaceae bacterium]|nr:fimbrillin family protein [Muribaculaceae bacterium]